MEAEEAADEPEAVAEERDHLRSIARSFLLYEAFMEVELSRRLRGEAAVPQRLRAHMPLLVQDEHSPISKHQSLRECIQVNQSFLSRIVSSYPFGIPVPLSGR
jgi:hypothetical protein